MFKIIFTGIFYLLLTTHIIARPVSYPGGITFMQMNDTNKNSIHLHYSLNSKVSFGYRFEYLREKEFSINALQMNNLVKRWNKKILKQIYILSQLLAVHLVIKGGLTKKIIFQDLLVCLQIGKTDVISFSMKIVTPKLGKSTISFNNLFVLV